MIELEFRDGKKPVPHHLAKLLAALDIHTMTYETAMARLNSTFLTDHLSKVQGAVVREHIARFGNSE